jgi:DNA-binding GntR family transcriptional regulator
MGARVSEGTRAAAKPGRKSELTVDARLSQTLIREIVDNRHPPGSWLREQEIAARHGVSRASVREALRNVAYAGFVEMRPWRGAQVTVVGADELVDIFHLLEGLYGQCARMAANRFPASRFGRLDRLVAAGERAWTKGAPKAELYARSFAIGQMVGRHCGNRLAYRLLMQVGNLALWQQRLLGVGTAQSEAQSVHAHRLMIEAIKGRDPLVAESAARTIVAITRRSLASAREAP